MVKLRILLLIFPLLTFCQQKKTEAQLFQEELVKSYEDKDTSPLDAKERREFKGIHFFPISEKYMVMAHLEKLENEKPFLMPSTGKKQNWYKKYGKITFVIDGVTYSLYVYQNQDLLRSPQHKNHLFLPFNDLTNGNTTYGGGRYIDLSIPEADTLIVDFNQAYNPYCAYSPRYSCPITPEENFIDVAILAGVTYTTDEN